MVVVSDVPNMFWGVTIDEGKRYTQVVERSFHVSMAALEPSSAKPEAVSVMVQHDKAEFLICTLQKGSLFQQPLDLNFTEGEELTFFLNGKGVVHLTGYLIEDDRESMGDYAEMDAMDDMSEDDMASSDEDDDDEDSEEDVPPILKSLKCNLEMADDSDEDESDDEEDEDYSTNKRKKKNQEQKKGAKKPRVVLEQDEDDDDDSEDDEDYDIEDFVADDDDDDDDSDMEDDDEDEDDDDDDEEDDEEEEEEEEVVVSKKAKKTPAKKDKSPSKESPQKAKTPNQKTPKAATNGKATPSPTEKTPKQQEKAAETPKSKKKNKNKKNGETTPAAAVANGQQKKQQTPGKEQKTPAGKTPNEKAKTPAAKTPSGTPKKRVIDGGVVLEELKEGHGPEAKKGKMVKVNYVGKLTSGKVFDSSTKKPFGFKLGMNEVIKGWDAGVAGMKVGGRRKLTIPPKFAYGNQKLPGIPANSTLVFDVELKSVS